MQILCKKLVLLYVIPSVAKLPMVIPGMGLTALAVLCILFIDTFYLNSIGSGLSVLSGSFNVTAINLLLGGFMFILVGLIFNYSINLSNITVLIEILPILLVPIFFIFIILTLILLYVTFDSVIFPLIAIIYSLFILVKQCKHIIDKKDVNSNSIYKLFDQYKYYLLNLNIAPILFIIKSTNFNSLNKIILGIVFLLIVNCIITSSNFINLIIRLESDVIHLLHILQTIFSNLNIKTSTSENQIGRTGLTIPNNLILSSFLNNNFVDNINHINTSIKNYFINFTLYLFNNSDLYYLPIADTSLIEIVDMEFKRNIFVDKIVKNDNTTCSLTYNKLNAVHTYDKDNNNELRAPPNTNTSNISENKENVNPWYVTGLSDAESSFIISFYRRKGFIKWEIKASFELWLHNVDINALHKIKDYFGVGNLNTRKTREITSFSVSKMDDLVNVIIPHFRQFPLETQKRIDFEIWSKIIEMMAKNKHLTIEGMLKIVSLKSILNKGLPTAILAAFPNINILDRPIHSTSVSKFKPIIKSWLSGFTAGDGNFDISIIPRSYGYQVLLRFRITQHIRDFKLLNLFCSLLNCGRVNIRSTNRACDYVVADLPSILNIIIPLFKEYPLITIKQKDFDHFCQAAELIKNKQHLTSEGLIKIREIKSKINNSKVELRESTSNIKSTKNENSNV